MRGIPTEPLARYIERSYPDCHVKTTGHARSEGRDHKGRLADMLSELTGVDSRTLSRIIGRERIAIDTKTVDEVCACLSIHPAVIYGDEWTHKFCPDCGGVVPLSGYDMKRDKNGEEYFQPICHKCRLARNRLRRVTA